MITTEWTRYSNEAAYHTALQCARGRYQRALLEGQEASSGSTLEGKAARWSGAYAASREALYKRLRAAKLRVKRVPSKVRGRIMLVVTR